MNRKQAAAAELVYRARRKACIAGVVSRFFVHSPDARHVVRRTWVGEVVAAALREPWSPALAGEARDAALELGARPIVFCNRRLFANLLPRHVNEQAANEMATALRTNPKKWERGSAPILGDR